jgi:hypothetical protein
MFSWTDQWQDIDNSYGWVCLAYIDLHIITTIISCCKKRSLRGGRGYIKIHKNPQNILINNSSIYQKSFSGVMETFLHFCRALALKTYMYRIFVTLCVNFSKMYSLTLQFYNPWWSLTAYVLPPQIYRTIRLRLRKFGAKKCTKLCYTVWKAQWNYVMPMNFFLWCKVDWLPRAVRT